ncbi:MAG: ABC transporter substrate-binding protein [Microbacterium sp.]|uniref:ABC transporter substrate-binding protein n=1 Tax=Microbacterium sp. TaxID=51671 RepID=UPI0039E5388F
MSIFLPSRTPRLALAATVVVALAALAGCSDGTQAATAGDADGGTYVFGVAEPDGNITPQTASAAAAQIIVSLANASLIEVTSDGTLLPQLATGWEASSDGLTWTVQLREGAEFSDGSAITTQDVVESFDSIIADDSQSPAKSSFSGILDSVAAGSDDSSVVFTLDRAYSDFPYLLAGTDTYILPAGVDDTNWLQDPVGAGQFVLQSYTAGQGVVYTRNPNYWDADNVLLDGVEIKFYADTQSQLLAFQSGEIDSISASTEVTAALDTSDYREVQSGYVKFDGLTFNVDQAPFDDADVREAVAWALDRDAIVDTVYGGNGVVANDVPYFPDYGIQPEGLTQRSQDLDKVAELLDGRTVSFTLTTYEGEQTYAELIQQQLEATGYFTVDLDILTEAEYYADGDSTPWLNAAVTITDWAERLPSQYVGLIYSSTSSWNASHYANPTLEDLSAQFDATTDADEQQSLTDQIAEIEWTDVPVVIAAFQESDTLLSLSVQGDFQSSRAWSQDYRGITVSD